MGVSCGQNTLMVGFVLGALTHEGQLQLVNEGFFICTLRAISASSAL
jgi:hypothetical protein